MTFGSKQFILQKRYQGCGINLTGDGDEALLAKYEAEGGWVAEPKCDGIWGQGFILRDRNVFTSKNMVKNIGLEDWKRPELTEGTLIIGEPGYGSQEATERRAQLGHPYIDVFDILIINYEDVSQRGDDERRRLLERWYALLDPQTKCRFRLVPRFFKDFVQEYRNQSEGLVLKRLGDRPYTGKGRKPTHWVKCKKAYRIDMVILDWKPSSADTKQREPMVESVLCGQFVRGKLEGLVWVGSMEHWLQRDIAQNFGKYKGRVVRLRHYGQFKSGSLRHVSVDPEETFPNTPATSCVFK
jgi:hypothetical protein